MSAPSLAARLTRQSGSSFYYAFRLLPAAKRQAIFAFYAFCRAVDDCVDEEGGEGEAGLRRWMEEVERCYAGRPQTELGREIVQAVARYPIPRRCFEDVLAGCRMDLRQARYRRYDDLLVYCRRVASAVGLASIEIFGYRHPAAREYAVELGLALQLTNILRDVGGDAQRGRLYLPIEDLEQFGVGEQELLLAAVGQGPRTPRMTELLAFEGHRARGHYARAAELLPDEDRRSLLAAEVMGAVYKALLERLSARGWPLGLERERISRGRRLWIALRTAVATYAGS